MKNKKSEYAEIIKWNIYEEPSLIKSVGGIEILPIKYSEMPDSDEKIKVEISIPNFPTRILNLPQNVNSFYPNILNNSPKTVIHGHLDRQSGDCEYQIAIKKKVVIKKGDVVSSVFGLGVMPLAGKIKRMTSGQFEYVSSIRKDIAKNVHISDVLQKPDYEADQKFLSSWDDDVAAKGATRYGYMAIASMVVALVFILIGVLSSFSNSTIFIFIAIFLYMSINMLHRRYEAKNKRRVRFYRYFLKLITGKGF